MKQKTGAVIVRGKNSEKSRALYEKGHVCVERHVQKKENSGGDCVAGRHMYPWNRRVLGEK